MTEEHDRHWIMAEIQRVTEAMKRTTSPHLRNDYGKYRRKLNKALNTKKNP